LSTSSIRPGRDGRRHAGYADALLRRRAGWEVVAPTRLALVSFCYADGSRTPAELEAVNRRVADAMLVDELATLSSTVLGRYRAALARRGRLALVPLAAAAPVAAGGSANRTGSTPSGSARNWPV
jgi:hypothetical protein